MVGEQLVFEQTIEALFLKAAGGRFSAKALDRLRKIGLNLEQKLLPAYPFATWMAALRVASEELFPGVPHDEASFKLGELFIDGYRETILGRAVLSMIRLLGPKRTLARSTQNFRSGNNYTETRLTERGPGHYELWMNEVGDCPTFTAGIISAGIRAAGAKELKVEVTDYDGHACVYRVRWTQD